MRHMTLFHSVTAIALGSLLAIGGCSVPDKLEAPTWDVVMEDIPVFRADTVYVGRDIEDENIKAGENDILTATFTERLDFSVDDAMVLAPISTSLDGQIGSLPTTVPLVITDEIAVSTSTIQVDNTEVLSGHLFFDFTNNIPRDVIVFYQLTNVTRDGVVLADSVTIASGGFVSVPEDLAGAQLQLNGGGMDVALIVNIQTGGSTVLPTHGVVANIATDEIQLQSVTGDIDLVIDVPKISEQLFDNLPVDGLDTLDLENAIVTFDYGPYGFATDANMSVTGQRSTFADRTVAAAFSAAADASVTTVLDNTGQDGDGATPTVVDIFRMLPEQVEIDGTVRLSGTGATVDRSVDYGLDATVEVPMTFSLSPIEVESVERIDLDDFVEESIEDNVITAMLTGTIENWTPLAGSLEVLVGPNESTVGATPLIDPIILAAGIDNNGDGIVDEPGISLLAVGFTETTAHRLDALINSDYFITTFQMSVDGRKSITANDVVIIRDVFLSGELNIDPENLEDRAN
jgi:hypothetical protein